MTTITSSESSSPTVKRRQDIITVFLAFGQELDEYTDRRERLVKEISNELLGQNENFWRYHKTISPGLQEYIEAVSFAKYLKDQTLLSFTDLQQDLRNADGIPFFPLGLPHVDYLLGISDLTGELMRFAISSVGSQGLLIASREVFSSSLSICNFVRDCKASLDPMSAHISELRQKQEVTTASLRKIEEVVYSLSIRGLGDAKMSNFNVVNNLQLDSKCFDDKD
ncbi:hypothetical protein Clacol_003674 [Clathrus columnatus]|uniref:Translin n=1 Tax=Clathrus columnatus TaxID=1419009 RepID=A0AAV5A463_9AGAM|nr:hypothetical protein Clacol_003674 [Clathrus columnatus]